MNTNDLVIKKGEVLTGSSILRDENLGKNRIDYFLENMAENKAIQWAEKQSSDKTLLVEKYRQLYLSYRGNWRDQPRSCIAGKHSVDEMNEKEQAPLCVDIEVAAICDLACPFCHRQYIATPDKLIDSDLCYRLIDEVAELGVPSIKFNLRGEPLLHPKLPQFIRYAKEKGILETGINTNATQLSADYSRRLIESGLDILIFSFDGGTKETYETMRPGRFRENTFEHVYSNITGFSQIRKEMKSAFPFTKIQMILTKETYKEKADFFKLFGDFVDEVAVTQYQERGANLDVLNPVDRRLYQERIDSSSLSNTTPFRLDADGGFFISTKRSPCYQPFQRLTVTYEGRVGMCCIDWGATHPVGFVDRCAFENSDVYKTIKDRATKGKKGYELLNDVVVKENTGNCDHTITNLKDIWYGSEIQNVRETQYRCQLDEISICSKCSSPDTYRWEKIR